MRQGIDGQQRGTDARGPMWSGRAGRIAAGAAILPLVLSGCGFFGGDSPAKGSGGGGNPTGQPPNANTKPIATAPLDSQYGKARTELLSLDRGASNTVMARFRVVNEGTAPFNLLSAMSAPGDTSYSVAGTTLVDAANNKRYFPLVGADGKCLCTQTLSTKFQPNQPVELFAIFPAPPQDVQRIGVSVRLTPVFSDVPIGAGPAQLPPGATADPAKAQPKPPKILPLIATVEGDEQAEDEDDNNQNIRLAADVLFALNKADITARAKSILTEVAKRIDQSQGPTVKVDGHTDNSGNDAINEPLSKRRAEAVEKVLKGAVTRQGVTYQSAGHGSKQPVADNSTSEGRQQNRRVTVSFAKPALPKPTTAPAPAPSPAPTDGSPVATAKAKDSDVQEIKTDVLTFKRDGAGMVNLVWTANNSAAQDFYAHGRFSKPVSDVLYFRGEGAMGVTLRDDSTGQRYYTLRDSEQRCVCYEIVPGGNSYVKKGQTATYYNAFKLPPGARSMTIEIPGYQPIPNIAISS
jgi:outer membrane protein OmpA-like peptidoglycan-associated protein